MQRPIAINLIAILGFVYAIILIGSGIVVLTGGSLSAIIARPLATLGVGSGLLLIGGGVLDFIAAYGLFRLRRWGWGLSVALLMLYMILSLVRIVAEADMVDSTLSFIAAGLVLWVLLLPASRRVYRPPVELPTAA